MCVPAALSISKLIYPETQDTILRKRDFKSYKPATKSILDAGTKGATDAIKLYLSIIANIIAFIAFFSLINGVLSYLGEMVGFENLTLEYLLGYLFTPISWLIGVPWSETRYIGDVIGIKLVYNELQAYQKLIDLRQQGLVSVSIFFNFIKYEITEKKRKRTL